MANQEAAERETVPQEVIKKERKPAPPAEKDNKTSGVAEAIEPVREYFRDTAGELRKVHWPSRLEARNLTVVVLVTLVVTSLLLGAMDYLFERLMLGVIALDIVSIAIMVVIAAAVVVLVVFASRGRNRY